MAVNCRGFQSVFSDRALNGWSDDNRDNDRDDDDDDDGDGDERMSPHLAPSREIDLNS